MSSNESAGAQQPTEISEKARGKTVEQSGAADMSMDEEESSGEESGAEEVSMAGNGVTEKLKANSAPGPRGYASAQIWSHGRWTNEQ